MSHEPGAACRVVLIGMMGSGKTTIGRLLSKATGWPYVDNDELVRRRSGSTSRELLASGGRPLLRRVESEALTLGLELPGPVILGAAAGTVLDPASRERMRISGTVVWLRASVEALTERAMDADHRPFVDTAGRSWLVEAAQEREPLYLEVADLVVETDVGTPADGVTAIREHMRGTGCREANA